MCQISGISAKYFVWSTFEHSGCHIIYVKLNSKEVFIWNYRFSSKISDRKIYFLDVKNVRSWFSKIFMEIFKIFEISKISIEISIENFEISKILKIFMKIFENRDRKFWHPKIYFSTGFFLWKSIFFYKPLQKLNWHK